MLLIPTDITVNDTPRSAETSVACAYSDVFRCVNAFAYCDAFRFCFHIYSFVSAYLLVGFFDSCILQKNRNPTIGRIHG